MGLLRTASGQDEACSALYSGMGGQHRAQYGAYLSRHRARRLQFHRVQGGCGLLGGSLVEEGRENLTRVLPTRVFEKGDIIWLVGEEADLQKIQEKS